MAEKILITGGAGYVGSALVPNLLKKGYQVIVYDLYIYGNVFENLKHPNLVQIKADIRDEQKIIETGRGIDQIIHLACISNDPSFDLDPKLGKSINYDAFFNIIETVEQNKIKRLIYASSSSIYGVKDLSEEVVEESKPEPITDYALYKLECEKVLEQTDINYVAVRPGTICGYAPRLRLDLTVNILTMKGLVNKKITVHGGSQMRTHLNIKDMVRFYEQMLLLPDDLIKRQVFNVSYQNQSVEETAKLIKNILGDDVVIEKQEKNVDNRSYRLNCDKMKRVLNFETKYTIEDAVTSLKTAFEKGVIKDPVTNPIYNNVQTMKSLNLK